MQASVHCVSSSPAPSSSHVNNSRPAQLVVPGTHSSGKHAPAMQLSAPQSSRSPNAMPSGSQRCDALPTQRASPAVQILASHVAPPASSSTQAQPKPPSSHTSSQLDTVESVPVASHTTSALPAHTTASQN